MHGIAVKEWNRSSIARPMPTPSDMGMGPWEGINGVFLKCWQFWTVLRMAVACASIIATALPPMASRFARRTNMTYASSNPLTGRRPSRLINQQILHWNCIEVCAPRTPWLIQNTHLSCLYHLFPSSSCILLTGNFPCPRHL